MPNTPCVVRLFEIGWPACRRTWATRSPAQAAPLMQHRLRDCSDQFRIKPPAVLDFAYLKVKTGRRQAARSLRNHDADTANAATLRQVATANVMANIMVHIALLRRLQAGALSV